MTTSRFQIDATAVIGTLPAGYHFTPTADVTATVEYGDPLATFEEAVQDAEHLASHLDDVVATEWIGATLRITHQDDETGSEWVEVWEVVEITEEADAA